MTLSGKQKLNLAVTAVLVSLLAGVAILSLIRVSGTATDFAHHAEEEAKRSLETVETIDSSLKTINDLQARSLQRQEAVEAAITDLGEQVNLLADEFVRMSQQMDETNRRVKIVTLKGSRFNTVLGDSIESLDAVISNMPASDDLYELQDVYDELYNSQNLLRKEIILSLQESSQSIDEFAERILTISAAVSLLADSATEQVEEVKGVSEAIASTSEKAVAGSKLSSSTVLAQQDILNRSGAMREDLSSSAARYKHLLLWTCILSLIALAVIAWFLSRSVITSLVDMIEELTQSKQSAGESSRSVATISSSLADGSMRLASVTEQTSSSVQEILSMARSNMDQSKGANGQAKATLQSTENMVGKMDEMSQAMEEINRSSSQIGGILKTIEEIAFQTNLLALNAAVEAARAGEAGAGFAVVAEEVRSLATRSSEAARKTSGVITRTQELTQVGHGHCTEASEALSHVLDDMKQMRERCESIWNASSEQVLGLDQLVESVQMMEQISGQLSSNSSQASMASGNMDKQLDVLSSEVDNLAQLVGGSALRSETLEIDDENDPFADFGETAAQTGERPAAQEDPFEFAEESSWRN